MSEVRLGPEVAAVLDRYPVDCRPTRCVPVIGAGGFSGARLSKLITPRGQLVLRRWPSAHPSPERLRFIHDVLRHVARLGIDFVPVPLAATNGETFVEEDGHLWELAPWLPGEANYIRLPSEKKLIAALSTLARLHLALASYPNGNALPAVSPGILERQARLAQLLQGGLTEFSAAVRPEIWPELEQYAQSILQLFPLAAPRVAAALADAASLAVPLQPCLRDIWHEHVLFDGDRVSGIIDFGALRIESVAADVARLLGSMAGDDAGQWQIGQTAYEALRPLCPEEKTLVRAFDRSGTLLSGCNWLEWIYVDRIEFPDRPAVIKRVNAIAGRLQRLIPSFKS